MPSKVKAEELIVVLDAPELGVARPVGVLSFWSDSGAVAFTYARSWLESSDGFDLEPRLPRVEGFQYFAGSTPPPILGDTSPDSWGIRLMERRAGRSLNPWSLLTGVDDQTRMGALRLQQGINGPFGDNSEPAIPPIAQLRALEAAAKAFETNPDAPIDDPNLELLLALGGSLGGARPKANFRDKDGSLWIAKFPSRTDRADIAAWEYVYAELAREAGIQVAETRLLSLGEGGRTFATRRFDRDGSSRRLYASAMTLTQRSDGEQASYLDIAQAIRQSGAAASVREDLEQLFRRLTFNVLAGNRDDHLRNHAFLRTPAGWRLSPAFDMNPGRAERQHSISIDGSTSAPDIGAALATHQVYGLSETRARGIILEVAGALQVWPDVASRHGIPKAEQRVIESALSALPSGLALAASE